MDKLENFTEYINFLSVLSDLKDRGNSKSEQGTLFELFCKKILEVSPFFSDDVNHVWMWKDFPGNGGKHDIGIDIVVLDKQGKYWAVQCKFYDQDAKVSKADIDSFVSAATKSFYIDGKACQFSVKLVFSTTENISQNASGLFTTFGPDSIFECGIDWNNFSLDDIDAIKVASKKTPKDHQKAAIADVLKGFETSPRGRLIMACGTGKTFTSLKIVEGLYSRERKSFSHERQFNVLYLVPSIALLSQTIIEWKTQQEFNGSVRTFGVCSDETAGQTKAKKKDEDAILVTMPIPATTDVDRLLDAYGSGRSDVNIFFSTYQSIDVISDFAEKAGIAFDVAVCDEAHRTIGAFKDGDGESSNFTKIHEDRFVPCKKRLYMTATEKIYSSNAKQEAEEGGWSVYSMDDEKVYGPQFHYLSFGQAVTNNLLTDYRLIVLNIRKSDIARLKLPESAFESLDTASKIVGSLAALSKIPSELSPDEFKSDPNPMKRSVAFCSTIAQAKAVAESYNHLSDEKCLGKEYMESQGFIIPKAKLITGQNNTREKNKLLDWLRGDVEDGTCHILTNARCLSEGVDVPSLDSIIFIARRRSQVDIIQAVGRVMRKFGSGSEKKYGYIIIPVVVNDEKMTDKALSSNEDYKVVWQVVQALRSHDERLDTEINKIGVTGRLPESICVLDTFVPPRTKDGVVVGSRRKESSEGWDTDDPSVQNGGGDFSIPIPSDEELRRNEQLFSAQLVKHCGNRLYWEDWSRNIGDVTNNVALRIKQQIDSDDKTKKSFARFLSDFRKLLNPGIGEQDAINMLAEHIVTLPVLKAIFNENDLIDENPVTQIMESMVRKLRNTGDDTAELKPFYESVRTTVKGVTSSEGRQEIIRKLFEKFFQYALPSSAEKFGIVYTPVEIVDFIVNSVCDVLKSEFGESISSRGIKVLDPFTGTGTFIVRLLDKLKEMGISREDLKSKYENDIWCNEIMLMAYYIALINIEDAFGRLSGSYAPFGHAVLTDTFQLAEKRRNKFYQTALFEDEEFKAANSKAKEEDETDIRVIFGNPPYSVGQKNANDNNQKDSYPGLDDRIRETYLRGVNKNASPVFDSYVRAFRWASDRIGEDGIVSFVSNGSYVDNLSFSGFRRELLKEFNHVYVFNLRGNQRTQGELSRKEGGKIFGSGSRNTICIIVLVKHRGQPFDGFVHYKDIGDYLSREEKLKIVQDAGSIESIQWDEIYPDRNNDWLNKTDENFGKFMLLGNKKEADSSAVFAGFYSRGIATGKDAWQYNFSLSTLKQQNEIYLRTYNSEVRRWNDLKKDNPNSQVTFKDFVSKDPKTIKWSNALYIKGNRCLTIDDNHDYRTVLYRPFVKKKVAFNPPLFYDFVKWGNLKPKNEFENLSIIIPGIGDKQKFSALVSDQIIDLHVIGASQCFPLYWYTENTGRFLLGSEVEVGNYIRDDSIVPSIVERFRDKYGDKTIDSQAIFDYVYGLFHSAEYRSKYKNNLAKEMPRIPFMRDFWGYSRIGKRLIELHLNYESAPAYDGLTINKKKDDYRVTKIRFLSKERRDTIIYNDSIVIEGIPLETYSYVVNGRSPIEWVMDQYQYSVDAESGIVDDPNLYDESKGGKYIFDLLLSLITVSLETLKLVEQLPKYEEIE